MAKHVHTHAQYRGSEAYGGESARLWTQTSKSRQHLDATSEDTTVVTCMVTDHLGKTGGILVLLNKAEVCLCLDDIWTRYFLCILLPF